MLYSCRRIAHEYPNAALLLLGLALVILVELHSKSVFFAYYGLHYQKWTPHPLIADAIDLWWWAEHRTAYVALQVLVTFAGGIVALCGAFRGLVHWARGPGWRGP